MFTFAGDDDWAASERGHVFDDGRATPERCWSDVVGIGVTMWRPATFRRRPPPHATRHPRWADLMRRAFGLDVQACDRCGGRLRLVAIS